MPLDVCFYSFVMLVGEHHRNILVQLSDQQSRAGGRNCVLETSVSVPDDR